MLPGSTLVWRAGAVVALIVGVWLHGYHRGQQGPLRELAAVQAVATATDARYRQLETEVADAQRAHVDAWKSARRDADDAWVRLAADRRGRVPTLCPQPRSPEADQRDGLGTAGPQSGGDVLDAVVGAMKVGEELEATLALCQQELRQCAGMR